MDDQQHENLFELASRFRRAILMSDPSNSPLATLRNFPHDACGDASLLLAKYLQVNRCGQALYTLGQRAGRHHAWLQLQEFTIDITADQFDDQDAGVIVATESPWHSAFNGKIHNVADFCLYDRHSVFQLTMAYNEIARYILV